MLSWCHASPALGSVLHAVVAARSLLCPRALILQPIAMHCASPPRRSPTLDQWLLHDGMKAQLLDPEFAAVTVALMELQVGSCAALR